VGHQLSTEFLIDCISERENEHFDPLVQIWKRGVKYWLVAQLVLALNLMIRERMDFGALLFNLDVSTHFRRAESSFLRSQ
jgi:hypothetical protein